MDNTISDIERMSSLSLTSSIEEEDPLAIAKQQVLEENHNLLCQNLFPERHFNYLRSVSILSEDDCEDIGKEHIRSQKARVFISILTKKGSQAYDQLCRSLIADKTQPFLLKQLNESLERRRFIFNEGESLTISSSDDDTDSVGATLPKPGDDGAPLVPNMLNGAKAD